MGSNIAPPLIPPFYQMENTLVVIAPARSITLSIQPAQSAMPGTVNWLKAALVNESMAFAPASRILGSTPALYLVAAGGASRNLVCFAGDRDDAYNYQGKYEQHMVDGVCIYAVWPSGSSDLNDAEYLFGWLTPAAKKIACNFITEAVQALADEINEDSE